MLRIPRFFFFSSAKLVPPSPGFDSVSDEATTRKIILLWTWNQKDAVVAIVVVVDVVAVAALVRLFFSPSFQRSDCLC